MPKAHYDTFLSHNSDDKPAVEALAHKLNQEGPLEDRLEVWLDKWHLISGNPWHTLALPRNRASLHPGYRLHLGCWR